jgi:DNA mismatch endonuclease (patch repair protein)
MDTISRKLRNRTMAAVRGKDTKPEMLVRCLAHSLGYRCRLHNRKLPGVPDLVFPGRRKIIFVHGCFWHRHPGCSLARLPKSRLEFWVPKSEGNHERDAKNVKLLRRDGWRVKVIWECETKQPERLRKGLERFLQ